MYRHKINSFCSDSSQNTYEFKLKSMSNNTIDMTIFQTADFRIEILDNGEFKVSAQCYDLEGQWEDNINAYLRESQTKDLTLLLQRASTEFTNLPEMSEDLFSPTSAAPNTDDLLSPTSMHHDEYLTDEEAEIAALGEELFDSVIDKESTLMKEKQQKVLAAAQDRKMLEVQAKGHLNEIVDQAKAKGLEVKDISSHKTTDPNVRQLYVTFYFDGFTIGNTESPNEDLELRQMEDERQKPILKSFQAGYVPREFSGTAKEVDVHMIYKQCNFEDRFKKEEELQKSREEYARQLQEREKRERGEGEELVKIEGLGEFTQEELDEQRRLLEEYQKSSKSSETRVEKPVENKNQESKKDDNKTQTIRTEETKETSSTTTTGQKLGQTQSTTFTKDTNFTYTVDEDKKLTTLQFLMMQDNQQPRRERARFNVDSTVHVLYQYVAHKFGLDGNFILTFSGKPLKEHEKTLDELRITNATIRVVVLE